MKKMLLRPDADGYGDSESSDVLRTALDGGKGRYRLDKVGSTKMVNVKWTMNPTQYAYWRAFFVTGTKKGALPFLCDLVGEDGLGPAEHECSFMPGSVGKPGQMGLTYIQQAQLEVKPLAHDEEADLALMDLFEYTNGDPARYLGLMERLVNVNFPDAMT